MERFFSERPQDFQESWTDLKQWGCHRPPLTSAGSAPVFLSLVTLPSFSCLQMLPVACQHDFILGLTKLNTEKRILSLFWQFPVSPQKTRQVGRNIPECLGEPATKPLRSNGMSPAGLGAFLRSAPDETLLSPVKTRRIKEH